MAAGFASRTYDCRSRTPRFLGSRVSPLNRGVQKLRIGWEGDVLGLHGGIDRDPRQILRPQRPVLVRHPQALGQEKFQLVAEGACANGSGPSARAETRVGRTPLQ